MTTEESYFAGWISKKHRIGWVISPYRKDKYEMLLGNRISSAPVDAAAAGAQRPDNYAFLVRDPDSLRDAVLAAGYTFQSMAHAVGRHKGWLYATMMEGRRVDPEIGHKIANLLGTKAIRLFRPVPLRSLKK